MSSSSRSSLVFHQEDRIDPEDGRPYPRVSFLEQYGPEEGLRRWQAAGRQQMPGVPGLGIKCQEGCDREAEVYCHDCNIAYCTHVCCVTAHRKKELQHNRITYTLAGARVVLDNVEASVKFLDESPMTMFSFQNSLNDLLQRKAAAIAAEDYAEAQRLKESIQTLQQQHPQSHVAGPQAGQVPHKHVPAYPGNRSFGSTPFATPVPQFTPHAPSWIGSPNRTVQSWTL
ncbi:hypothetical protein DIPPA_53615 [Diplonema papillatum]|nr:hypothetical protein DIPPA_53615 [Diplonema papillatum]